jgi:succinate dehydrogenase / fumarate reductase cytochrome b subunit
MRSVVGRKLLMAVSGILLLVFVALHLLGNSFNPAAFELPDVGRLQELIRLLMFVMLAIHAALGIQLTMENSAATPKAYAIKSRTRATFSSENMIVTGLIVLAFLCYHLLQFVFGVVEGDLESLFTIAIYVVAGISLFLHLFHGVGSFFQTLGWNSDKSLPVMNRIGNVVSVIVLGGFIYILFQA